MWRASSQRTFVCSLSKDDAGPTNNWVNPFEMRTRAEGAVRRRDGGPDDVRAARSAWAPIGSPMSRIARPAHRFTLRRRQHAHHGAHRAAGVPRSSTATCSGSCPACTAWARRSRRASRTCPGPAIRKSTSSTFRRPARSGRSDPATAATRCSARSVSALRIASNIARDEGWMAEHMLILGVEDPQGEKTYISAAFPSACGKTNLAMLIPPDAHERLESLDGRRRHRVDQAGRERPSVRDQSRGRRFRRRARHVDEDQPERDGDGRAKHDLHQRRADARWRRVVGGHDGRAAGRVPRLAGRALDAGDRRDDRAKPAAHPNARFTAPARQCPIIDSGLGIPEGVPISAIIFGGRRAHTMPLRLSVVQLDVGRLHRRDDGIGDDRRGDGQRRDASPRSDGDAAVLRLSHGRLFPALDQDAAVAQRDAARSST